MTDFYGLLEGSTQYGLWNFGMHFASPDDVVSNALIAWRDFCQTLILGDSGTTTYGWSLGGSDTTVALNVRAYAFATGTGVKFFPQSQPVSWAGLDTAVNDAPYQDAPLIIFYPTDGTPRCHGRLYLPPTTIDAINYGVYVSGYTDDIGRALDLAWTGFTGAGYTPTLYSRKTLLTHAIGRWKVKTVPATIRSRARRQPDTGVTVVP